MKKPAVLKLNGKPLDLHPLPASVVAVQTFLDKSPADELFTRDELARRANVPMNTLKCAGFSTRTELEPYTAIAGKYRYWGNPKAVIALREQLAGEQ